MQGETLKILTRLKFTLHDDQLTFMIISPATLLRMRNISDKLCRENEDKDFTFNNIFAKTVPFMR